MFSSPETDRKIRMLNLVLSIIAAILLVGFSFVVVFDKTTEQQQLSYDIEKSKRDEEKQRQEIFEERKKQAEYEKKKETDSFYEKLNDGFDVKILIIGDQIGVGDGASDNSKTWIDLLKNQIEKNYDVSVYVKNISMAGNSSYAGYVRTMVLSDRIEYDLAIICYGQNDAENNFQIHYESLIRAVRNNFEKCSIISVLESSQMKYTNKIKVIQELGSHYGVAVADTIAPFIDGSNGKYETLTEDKILPNDKGHRIYADTIYSVIDEQVDNRTVYDSTEIEPINAETDDFNELLAINARDFTREGNNYVYRLTTPIKGIVGIDYKYLSGENGCKILIDGKEYTAPESNPINDTFQLRILLLSDKKIEIKSSIEVRFPTTDQSDGFRGVCVSSDAFD